MNKLETFNKNQIKREAPDIRPGDTIRVWQKVKEGDRERLQMFEGVIIARKHGKGQTATITVRKISFGVGVERIYPLHSPSIEKIELVQRGKVRRAKLYHLRRAIGKKGRLKRKDLKEGAKESVGATYRKEEPTPENQNEESEPALANPPAGGEKAPVNETKDTSA